MDIQAIIDQVVQTVTNAPEKINDILADPRAAIEDITGQTLGEGDVTVTLALPEASSVADAGQASPPLYTEVYTANGRMVLRQQGEAGLDRLERGHYIVRKAFANRQAETKKITK